MHLLVTHNGGRTTGATNVQPAPAANQHCMHRTHGRRCPFLWRTLVTTFVHPVHESNGGQLAAAGRLLALMGWPIAPRQGIRLKIRA